LLHITQLGRNPSIRDLNKLADRRRRLGTRITEFNKAAIIYLLDISLDDDVPNIQLDKIIRDIDLCIGEKVDDNPFYNLDDGAEIVTGSGTENHSEFEEPEKQLLLLPSAILNGSQNNFGVLAQASQELEIRIGTANDALHDLRMALGCKSLVFRTSVRDADSQRTITRAFAERLTVQNSIKTHVTNYTLARNAMVALNAPEDVLNKYQVIKHSDLKVDTISHDTSVYGIRNSHLPWIWKVSYIGDSNSSEWLMECRCLIKCRE
jgi:hypothetical protein